MPPVRRRRVEGPIGGAGLMRYFDIDEGGPKIDPKVIIGIVIAIILVEVILTLIK